VIVPWRASIASATWRTRRILWPKCLKLQRLSRMVLRQCQREGSDVVATVFYFGATNYPIFRNAQSASFDHKNRSYFFTDHCVS